MLLVGAGSVLQKRNKLGYNFISSYLSFVLPFTPVLNDIYHIYLILTYSFANICYDTPHIASLRVRSRFECAHTQ
jgi:hypothetical protein